MTTQLDDTLSSPRPCIDDFTDEDECFPYNDNDGDDGDDNDNEGGNDGEDDGDDSGDDDNDGQGEAILVSPTSIY